MKVGVVLSEVLVNNMDGVGMTDKCLRRRGKLLHRGEQLVQATLLQMANCDRYVYVCDH
jgi:hypothetical protein